MLTSWLGELGMSAPFQRPFTQISWNLAAGVLLYSRFQESMIILLGGSAAKGSFGFSFGFSSSGSGVAGAAGCTHSHQSGH